MHAAVIIICILWNGNIEYGSWIDGSIFSRCNHIEYGFHYVLSELHEAKNHTQS